MKSYASYKCSTIWLHMVNQTRKKLLSTIHKQKWQWIYWCLVSIPKWQQKEIIVVSNTSCIKDWINTNKKGLKQHQKTILITQMHLIFTNIYFEIITIREAQSNRRADCLNWEYRKFHQMTNGLQWKTYQRMDVDRGRGKPNWIIGKFTANINCWCKRGALCYDCRCSQRFYPDRYEQSKISQSTSDDEYYSITSVYAGGNVTRSLWSLCCLWKWTHIIVRPSVKSFVWDYGSIYAVLQTIQEWYLKIRIQF